MTACLIRTFRVLFYVCGKPAALGWIKFWPDAVISRSDSVHVRKFMLQHNITGTKFIHQVVTQHVWVSSWCHGQWRCLLPTLGVWSSDGTSDLHTFLFVCAHVHLHVQADGYLCALPIVHSCRHCSYMRKAHRDSAALDEICIQRNRAKN